MIYTQTITPNNSCQNSAETAAVPMTAKKDPKLDQWHQYLRAEIKNRLARSSSSLVDLAVWQGELVRRRNWAKN